MIRLALIAVLSVSLVACKDKKSNKEPAKQSKVAEPSDSGQKKASEPQPAVDQPIPDATLDEIAAEIEGFWVIKASALINGEIVTQKQAWNIGAGTATLVTTDGEKSGDFELVAPCRFKFSGGDPPATYFNFVMAGDQLHIGIGRAGLAIGDDVVACTGDGIFLIHQGKCTLWRQSASGEWSHEASDCALTSAGKGFRLGTYVIPGDGKVFADGQLQQAKAKRYKDFGSAKEAAGVAPE